MAGGAVGDERSGPERHWALRGRAFADHVLDIGSSPTGLELVYLVKPRRGAPWPKRRKWTGGRCAQPNAGPTTTRDGGQAQTEPGRYWAPR